MRTEIGRLEEDVRNAYGIADLLEERICKLKLAVESVADQTSERFGLSEDDKVLSSVLDMQSANGAMYEAMRYAQALEVYLESAKNSLRNAQKGLR